MQPPSRLHKHREEYRKLPDDEKKAYRVKLAKQYKLSEAYVKKVLYKYPASTRPAYSIKPKPKPTPAKITANSAFKDLTELIPPDPDIDFYLPLSLEKGFNPYILPKANNDILLLSDIHIPYHNSDALRAALKYGIDKKINTIFINGDLIDFYAISRFEHDPKERNLKGEIEKTREFLTILRSIFPVQDIYYKIGNHDERWRHYLIKNGELFDIDDFQLDSVLRLNEVGARVIGSNTITYAGDLTIVHGHEVGKSTFGVVNPARSLYLKTKGNTICGHHHQTSEQVENNIRGKIVACWSTGCLSELHPDYAPINKYNHGFAHVQIESDGKFTVFNKKIIDGVIH